MTYQASPPLRVVDRGDHFFPLWHVLRGRRIVGSIHGRPSGFQAVLSGTYGGGPAFPSLGLAVAFFVDQCGNEGSNSALVAKGGS